MEPSPGEMSAPHPASFPGPCLRLPLVMWPWIQTNTAPAPFTKLLTLTYCTWSANSVSTAILEGVPFGSQTPDVSSALGSYGPPAFPHSCPCPPTPTPPHSSTVKTERDLDTHWNSMKTKGGFHSQRGTGTGRGTERKSAGFTCGEFPVAERAPQAGCQSRSSAHRWEVWATEKN